MNDKTSTFGETLRFYREKLGMTRKLLAQTSGVCESSIQRYENDERIPKIENQEKLAIALHIPVTLLQGAQFATHSLRLHTDKTQLPFLIKTPISTSHDDIEAAMKSGFTPDNLQQKVAEKNCPDARMPAIIAILNEICEKFGWAWETELFNTIDIAI